MKNVVILNTAHVLRARISKVVIAAVAAAVAATTHYRIRLFICVRYVFIHFYCLPKQKHMA